MEFFAGDSSSLTHQCRWRQTYGETQNYTRQGVTRPLTSADTNASVCLYGPQKLRVLFSLVLANVFDRVVPLRDSQSPRRRRELIQSASYCQVLLPESSQRKVIFSPISFDVVVPYLTGIQAACVTNGFITSWSV